MMEHTWYPEVTRYWTPFVAVEGLDHLGVRVNHLAAAGRRLQATGAGKVSEIRYRGQLPLVFCEGHDNPWIELVLSPGEYAPAVPITYRWIGWSRSSRRKYATRPITAPTRITT